MNNTASEYDCSQERSFSTTYTHRDQMFICSKYNSGVPLNVLPMLYTTFCKTKIRFQNSVA